MTENVNNLLDRLKIISSKSAKFHIEETHLKTEKWLTAPPVRCVDKVVCITVSAKQTTPPAAYRPARRPTLHDPVRADRARRARLWRTVQCATLRDCHETNAILPKSDQWNNVKHSKNKPPDPLRRLLPVSVISLCRPATRHATTLPKKKKDLSSRCQWAWGLSWYSVV